MPQKRVTIAQVALAAGVSVTTVSLVLNNKPGSRIAPATAKKIRAAAQELGYLADPTARSLRTGRSRTIAFISDEVTTTRYASALIRGTLDVAAEHDHLVLMAETPFDSPGLPAAIDALAARRVDGFVFALMRSRHVRIPRLPRQTPAVIVNGTATVDDTDWVLPSVLPDELTAGHTAASHLLDAGHRRIALVGRSAELLDPQVSVTITHRLAGIDQALAHAGLTTAFEVEGAAWEPELGYRAGHQIAEFNAAHPDDPVTAVICANDRIAFGLYHSGLNAPDSMSVVSFDNEELASYLHPGLNSVQIPYLEMGRIAATLILEPTALRSHKNTGDALLVNMPLVTRQSVHPL